MMGRKREQRGQEAGMTEKGLEVLTEKRDDWEWVWKCEVDEEMEGLKEDTD